MSGWVRTGKHDGLGLTISRVPLEDAGDIGSGGPKIVWHTTEGGTLDSVVSTLRAKRAAPHFAIDTATGKVVQMVAFGRAGRALEHNEAPETNRSNAVQVEIVGFASESGKWSEKQYKNLAALALLIERHHKVPRKKRGFQRPLKFVGNGFVEFAGQCGHVHVPGNNHTDPGTGFRGQHLLELMDKHDKKGKK